VSPVPTIVNGIVILKIYLKARLVLYILDKSKLIITSISFILLEEYNNDVSSANSLESHNCKWHCHIENILKSTSSQLSMLRKFKFSLSYARHGQMPWICHKTLNKLFHDFPKPNKYYGKFLLIDALWNVYA
jgi:hypothetical protein